LADHRDWLNPGGGTRRQNRGDDHTGDSETNGKAEAALSNVNRETP